MNAPPATFIRVPPDQLHRFVLQVSEQAGLCESRAALLADLLTANDLRGVFSHGTTQIATYARLLRDGVLNPAPEVVVERETPVSLLMDGDGGLGYFPAYTGTLALIEKVKERGIGVLLTRNHGHFGAAGIYSRLTLPHDLLSFVTSGHQLHLQRDQPLVAAAGGSPMSFSAPAATETSLLLDFGAIHDMYVNSPYREALAKLAPGTVFRSIGLGAVCQTWGGFLAGIPLDPSRGSRTFSGANQGSLVIAFRIDLFMDADRFKREMDEYVRAVRQLQPLVGFEESFLPGGLEAERERAYRRDGVPVGPDHQKRLQDLAVEMGLQIPW